MKQNLEEILKNAVLAHKKGFLEEAEVSYRGLYCNNCGYISPFNGKPLRFLLD